MAWQKNIDPKTQYRGINETNHRYAGTTNTDVECVSITGTVTAENAIEQARNAAKNKISYYSSRDYANKMLKINSYFGEGEDYTITKQVQEVSNIPQSDENSKNIGDFYFAAHNTSTLGESRVVGDKASCSWSVQGIGGRRTSYTQCFEFNIEEGAAAFDNGEITIKVTNPTKYSFPAYLTVASEASFVDDYKTQPYVEFTIPSKAEETPKVVSLSSIANSIKGLGDNKKIFFIIGSTRQDVNSHISIDSAFLSYDLAYVKCPAPTNFSVTPSIVKPGGTCKLTWTPSSLTGYANKIKGYEISWTNNGGSVVANDASSVKVDGETAESKEFAIVSGDENRGNSCTFTIKAISSVENYDSDPVTAGAICTINTLPIINFNGNAEVTVPSTAESYTIIGTAADADRQVLKYKQDEDSSTLTEPPIDTAELTTIDGESFSEAVNVPPSSGESKTYYFHFWDGVEWTTKGFKLTKNKKPAYNNSTPFSLEGTMYTKNNFGDDKNNSYLPIFSTAMSKYEDESKTAAMRYFQIQIGDANGEAFENFGTQIVSADDIPNYSMVLNNLPKETYSYRLKAWYNDGIEDSDSITSAVYYVAQWPTIANIYNSYDKKDIDGANVGEDGKKDFFENFSIDFGNYDSFYFPSPGGGYEAGTAKIVIEPSSSLSSKEFKANSGENYCSYFNGNYENVPHDSDVTITAYAEFQNGYQTVRYEIGSKKLHRAQNLINTSYLAAWGDQYTLTVHPYTMTEFACTLPYNAIGDDKANSLTNFITFKGTNFEEGGIYYEKNSTGSYIVTTDQEKSDSKIYYVHSLSGSLEFKDGIKSSIYYNGSYIPEIGSVMPKFVWGGGTNAANKRAFNSLQAVNAIFTLQNVFGEKFEVSHVINLEYREPISVVLGGPEVCCKKSDSSSKEPDWLSISGVTLREGQLIRIPYTVTTYNSWDLLATLTSKIAGESKQEGTDSITVDNLPSPTKLNTQYMQFYLGEQTGVIDLQNAFTITVSPDGQGLSAFSGAASTTTAVTTERIVSSVFEIENDSYNKSPSSTESGQFLFALNFRDYGGKTSADQITTSNFKNNDSTKSYFALHDKNDAFLSKVAINFNDYKLTADSEGNIQPVIYNLVFSNDFPANSSSDYFKVSTTFVVDYEPITKDGNTYYPLHYVKSSAGYAVSEDGPHALSKTTYSQRVLIYNTAPTVRYGRNRLGINVNGFEADTNLVELAQHDNRTNVAAIGNSLYIVNFIIDGGNVGDWPQQEKQEEN